MFEVGTRVRVVGPKNRREIAIRDIWWNERKDAFIGQEYIIDDVVNPYDTDEEYDGVVYTLSGATYEYGRWYFVDEWLVSADEITDEIEEDIYCDDIMKLM